MSIRNLGSRRIIPFVVVSLFLVVFFLELNLSIRQQSQTWDESCHIFAGYRQWKNRDFGVNPEHPPLLKFLATAPLLRLPLHVPPAGSGQFKTAAFNQGREFLYRNDAELILGRTRLAASLISILLAALVFAAGRELFGLGAGLLGLLLMAFEPNLLAHGAVVTTDMAASCFLFASVYAYYRFMRKPNLPRLLLAGLACGLAISAKHSGILLFPILLLLALSDITIRRLQPDSEANGGSQQSLTTKALRGTAALAGVALIAVAILWSFYGFRYAARPNGLSLNPSFNQYVTRLQSPAQRTAVSFLAQHRLLPESYLYGLADVMQVAEDSPSYIFGNVYPHGQWFYFPSALVIKSTIPVLLLLLLVPVAIWPGRMKAWRELAFIALPPAFYFAVAVVSHLNIGLRHILPIFPFLMVLAGATAWKLAQWKRGWAVTVSVLLGFHVVSSARVFPTYLAYSNELWGGPANTYKYLTDSNTDWAQQLKATKQYLDSRGIKQCWFAYFAGSVAEPGYYGIPCKPLPSNSTRWLRTFFDVPPTIDGPVLISAATLSGYETGPGPLNPYAHFQSLKPTAIIQHGIFVFDGHFEIPLASATNHIGLANQRLTANRLDEALTEARRAVLLAPDSVQAQTTLARVLARMNRQDEALQIYQNALPLAQQLPVGYRDRWVSTIQQALSRKS